MMCDENSTFLPHIRKMSNEANIFLTVPWYRVINCNFLKVTNHTDFNCAGGKAALIKTALQFA